MPDTEVLVRLDLNNPVFQENLLSLQKAERHSALDTLHILEPRPMRLPGIDADPVSSICRAMTRNHEPPRGALPLCLLAGALLAGCGPRYSPDVYATNAAQQASKVESGVVAGVRPVRITASGATGGVTGGAAGGLAGAQVGIGPTSAFASLGGALLGGLAGVASEHVVSDTDAFEYIVRKPNGEMVSVTQKDLKPLKIGQKVLVIAGAQARIVVDYTVPADPGTKAPNVVQPGEPVAAPQSGGSQSGGSQSATSQPVTGFQPVLSQAEAPQSVASQSVAGSQPVPSQADVPGGQGGPLSSTTLPSGS